jgi:hypothetical protein
MVSASDMHNLVQYEVAKVVDDLQEVIILVWVPCDAFLLLPLQENKFRFSIS